MRKTLIYIFSSLTAAASSSLRATANREGWLYSLPQRVTANFEVELGCIVADTHAVHKFWGNIGLPCKRLNLRAGSERYKTRVTLW